MAEVAVPTPGCVCWDGGNLRRGRGRRRRRGARGRAGSAHGRPLRGAAGEESAARRLDRLVDRLRSAPAPRRISSPRASRTGPRITGATWPASTARSTIATTRICAASWPTPCPTPSAGCSVTASGSTGRCRSRRTRKPRMHNVLPNSRSFIAHLGRAARRARRRHPSARRAPSRCSSEHGASSASTARHPMARAASVPAAASCWPAATSPAIPSSRAASWARARPRWTASTSPRPATARSSALPLGARIVNGDLALGPELRFVPPQRQSFLLNLPPWPALANLMAWSLDHMPSALLRPFVMSFVTTALAPSPALFADGAILVNADGERFTDETDAPAFALPDQPSKIGYILLDARMAQRYSGLAALHLDRARRRLRLCRRLSPQPSRHLHQRGDPGRAGAQTRHAGGIACRNGDQAQRRDRGGNRESVPAPM